jgi:hypothetical protein
VGGQGTYIAGTDPCTFSLYRFVNAEVSEKEREGRGGALLSIARRWGVGLVGGQIAQTYIAGTDARTFSLYPLSNAEVSGERGRARLSGFLCDRIPAKVWGVKAPWLHHASAYLVPESDSPASRNLPPGA